MNSNVNDFILHNDKTFYDKRECLFKDTNNNCENSNNSQTFLNPNDNTTNASPELIDFEECIDLIRENNVEKTGEDIKGFENVFLCSFETCDLRHINDIEMFSLDEINDYLGQRETVSDGLNSLTVSNPPKGDSMTSNTDIIEEINNSLNDCPELASTVQVNDVPIHNRGETSLTIDVNGHNSDEQSQVKHDNNISVDLTESSQESYDPIQNTIYNDKNDNLGFKVSIVSTGNFVNSKSIKSDVISISSKEDTRSIDDDGYNSSDFEVITESEAQIEGYIINFRNDKDLSGTKIHNTKSKIGTSNNDIMDNGDRLNSEGYHTQQSQSVDEENDNGHISDPGEGPSGLNRRVHENSQNDLRQNHIIPEGDGYLDLFQGPFNPVLPVSEIILWENKSIRPSPMNVQYEGLGFDQQLLRRRNRLDSSEEEYEDEAKDSVRRILLMYPGENKKRRRRF